VHSRLIVPNLLRIICTIWLLALPAFSQTSMRQELTDEHVRREQAEAVAHDQASATAAIPPTCLPAPLPSLPRHPVFTSLAGTLPYPLRFEVWREPCYDTPTRTVPLIRITPLSGGTPFICSVEFAVIQAGLQYDIRLTSSSDPFAPGFCDNMLVPTTLLIAQSSFNPQFDDSQAFQLIYQDDLAHPLNIDAATPLPPQPYHPHPVGDSASTKRRFAPAIPFVWGSAHEIPVRLSSPISTSPCFCPMA
jgi:hypothetical protein